MSDEKWLLIKRDLYERPDRCGYTGIRDCAGRYSKEVAERHMAHHGPDSAVREEDAPEFRAAAFNDLVIAHLTKQRDTAHAEARNQALEEAAALADERGAATTATAIRALIAPAGEG
ncbi:hypothetical protein V5F79_22450 [Xanthobacter flavus]|uniref:hypothetical protein n=1 Tax=Xanthobacter flavus TaxID=281 RepID=UPI0037276CDB